MSNHEQFEELCAGAAGGTISPDERRELMKHLEQCPSCEKLFAQMKDLHATWLPHHSGFEIKRSFAAESRLRQSILERAAGDGARFSEEALLPKAPLVHNSARSWRSHVYAALTVAAMVLISFAGIRVLERTLSERNTHPPFVTNPNVGNIGDSSRSAQSDTLHLEELRESARKLQEVRAKLDIAVKQAQADRRNLQAEVDMAERRADTAQRSNATAAQELAALHTQLETARGSELKVQAQLNALRTSIVQKEAELSMVRTDNTDIRQKLGQQMASVDRDRELMADGREIRDLIAARNLHIIDVYDTSGEGKTQKSFGRVFYTEGKSLVFYAYDLPSRRPPAKYGYYAWGKRDSSGDVKVRNLGLFYNDDQTQRRWVLKITDPQVLSDIDSVFVTLEKTDDSGKTPTGKKLLSAYLGSPANHP